MVDKKAKGEKIVKSEQPSIEERVERLESLVSRLLKKTGLNDKPVSIPNRLENNNPDIMPMGGEIRSYAEIRQLNN